MSGVRVLAGAQKTFTILGLNNGGKDMLDYKEQLEHPLWQRKRLEIMQRDGFICKICGSGHISLNVHHLSYIPETHAWDHPDSLLLTTDKKCHQEEHETKEFLIFSCFLVIEILGLTGMTFNELNKKVTDEIDLLKSEGYKPNEAFKITILKLIQKS